jgi:hypothetical protein
MTPRREGIPAEPMDEDHIGLSLGILTAADRMQQAQSFRPLGYENINSNS